MVYITFFLDNDDELVRNCVKSYQNFTKIRKTCNHATRDARQDSKAEVRFV